VLALDGVDDFATAPYDPSLDLGEQRDFTLEAFFYVPDQTNDDFDYLFYRYFTTIASIRYSTSFPDLLAFSVYVGCPLCLKTTETINYSVELTAGWHHAAFVYDYLYTDSEDRLLMYLDGSLVATLISTELRPISNPDEPFNIGAGREAFRPYVGDIEEARISSTARYTGSSYSVPTSPFNPDANTMALWHFDESPGSTSFADASGEGNMLAGQNGARVEAR
jgi:hypothetical protein